MKQSFLFTALLFCSGGCDTSQREEIKNAGGALSHIEIVGAPQKTLTYELREYYDSEHHIRCFFTTHMVNGGASSSLSCVKETP